ncbi:MAG: UDP-N-acetylglucosamine 2-epimerase (non-hydrolyzing) [Ignavibacteriales bacterium]|nr:UDP-N-acetylglucosamine 2-epimerase (non-hydrolyzing) [Ignavibacteriales bacterium]
MKRIISVVGARPNFMKVAPLHRAFQKYSDRIRHLIVHTGQHYDEAMSKVFFEDLELPHPDFYLGVGSWTHAQQTAKIMVEFEKVLVEHKPDLVVVVGDVNSTVACSLVSVKMGIAVAHVEAGLRSFDRSMPEEINRLLTDSISDHLFVSEKSGLENLKREGVSEKKVFFVGNIMIDSLIHFREKAKLSNAAKNLGLQPNGFVLVTLHRPGNVDEKKDLETIFSIFKKIGDTATIVFPVHPRTRKMIQQYGLEMNGKVSKRVRLLDPLGYLEFLDLMQQSRLVLTDSGGIQEETTFLGIPCLTLRENTERPVTVEVGTNEICGLDENLIVRRSKEILNGNSNTGRIPELWDGHTAVRIAEILSAHLL